jgi:hypothetical protein
MGRRDIPIANPAKPSFTTDLLSMGFLLLDCSLLSADCVGKRRRASAVERKHHRH